VEGIKEEEEEGREPVDRASGEGAAHDAAGKRALVLVGFMGAAERPSRARGAGDEEECVTWRSS
jgi:hypothetical protein